MRPGAGQEICWREAKAYAPLLGADRAAFAWEWLRRDQGYRQAAAHADAEVRHHRPPICENKEAAAWGLHAFVAADEPAAEARPVWRRDWFPAVLVARTVQGGGSGDRFDLQRLRWLATLVVGESGGEHLLLSDGLRSVRVDVADGTLQSGPVALRFEITGLNSAEGPLLMLRRLIALSRTGRFSRVLHAPEARARRWILMLRAHDALAAGAGQREIAAELLGSAAAEPRWRNGSPSLRSQAQRLVRAARAQAAGGFRNLLR